MWATSPRFLEALKYSQRRATTCTYQNPGGAEIPLVPKGGTISLDDSSRIRRRANLTVLGSTSDYEAIMLAGTKIRIRHGLVIDSTPELVPVFCGEVNQGNQTLGGASGEIRLPLVDMATWLARSDFVTPYAPADILRSLAIRNIVEDAMPGVSVIVTATDTGTVGAGRVWTGSRLDAITQLATDGGMEAFFLPDGSYLIRDQASLSAPVTWTVRGLVKGGERQRPMEIPYNTVVVSPSASDGSQTWTTQVVSFTDTSSPRHSSKIGVVPYFLASPTASSAAAALRAGQVRLSRLQGNMDTLALDTIANPALEGGDLLRVVIPQTGDQPADIFQHIVDGFTMNIMTGGMDLNTRSQREAIV